MEEPRVDSRQSVSRFSEKIHDIHSDPWDKKKLWDHCEFGNMNSSGPYNQELSLRHTDWGSPIFRDPWPAKWRTPYLFPNLIDESNKPRSTESSPAFLNPCGSDEPTLHHHENYNASSQFSPFHSRKTNMTNVLPFSNSSVHRDRSFNPSDTLRSTNGSADSPKRTYAAPPQVYTKFDRPAEPILPTRTEALARPWAESFTSNSSKAPRVDSRFSTPEYSPASQAGSGSSSAYRKDDPTRTSTIRSLQSLEKPSAQASHCIGDILTSSSTQAYDTDGNIDKLTSNNSYENRTSHATHPSGQIDGLANLYGAYPETRFSTGYISRMGHEQASRSTATSATNRLGRVSGHELANISNLIGMVDTAFYNGLTETGWEKPSPRHDHHSVRSKPTQRATNKNFVEQNQYASTIRGQPSTDPSAGFAQYLSYMPMMMPYLVTQPLQHNACSEGFQSALLYEFKNNAKSKKYELADIYEHVAEFSGDQHGSRFIQTKLETANSEEKERIFCELQPNLLPLMTDVFGNYVIQKLFEHGDQTHKRIFAQRMSGHVLSLSLQMYGCRVVQKALDHVLVDQQAQIIGELQGNVLKCVKDQNGNHVVQKAIERCQPHTISFIVQAFQGQVRQLSVHPYGCRVIQRCLEHCEPSAQTSIMAELVEDIPTMISDSYGNYVVQNIVSKADGPVKRRVLDVIADGLEGYSKHKFASNVVEKCLEFADDQWRRNILHALLDHKGGKIDIEAVLVSFLKDNYGNYVIQKLLDTLCPADYTYFVSVLQPAVIHAKRSGCGKQILSIEKKMYRYSQTFVELPHHGAISYRFPPASQQNTASAAPVPASCMSSNTPMHTKTHLGQERYAE